MNERIKKLRKALDLTQQEFADKIGMKRNTIANYETDRNEPSNSVVSLICREFDVSEAWLRTGEGEMFVDRTRNDELDAFVNELMKEQPQDFRRRLVTALSRLKPEQWDTLETVALELMKDPAALVHASADAQDEVTAREIGKIAHDQFLLEKRQEDTSSASPGDTGFGEKMA